MAIMKLHGHGASVALHVLAGALVAAALLTAATAVAAAPPPVTSESFAPDWRAHTKDLIPLGSFRDGSQEWLVPPILSRGRYVVISLDKNGTRAELMQGYQFQVPSDASLRIKLWLPSGYDNLAVLPVADIPKANVRPREEPGIL